MRSVKTTAHDLNNKLQWCFHIFKAQKKKLKVKLKNSRNCSVCVRITVDEMKSSFARFDHVCFWLESLEKSVTLGRLVIFVFLGNSLLYSPLFPSRQPKSSTFYNVFVVRAVFKLLINKLLFRWRKKTYLKLRPLFGSQIFSVSKCSDIQGSNPLWLSVSFFDYWLIRMSGFFTFFASH